MTHFLVQDIIIDQEFDGLPIALDLKEVNWIVAIIILSTFLCLASCWPFCRRCWFYNYDESQCSAADRIKTYRASPITTTEIIYKLFAYNESLIKLTFISICGNKSIPKLEHIQNMKTKFEHTHKEKHRRSSMFYLVTVICYGSLLFACYLGVIFIVENTKYQNKYNIPFDCYYNPTNNICEIQSEMKSYKDSYLYDDFYQDVLYPYLIKHNPQIDIEQLEDSGLSLYLSPKGDMNQWLYTDLRYYDKIGEGIVDGFLYLDEHNVQHSDFHFVHIDYSTTQRTIKRSENGWCPCGAYGEKAIDCSCCVFWVGVGLCLLVFIIWAVLQPDLFDVKQQDLMDELSKILDEMRKIDHEWTV